MIDDLSRVRRAAFQAANFEDFRQKLLGQEIEKKDEGSQHPDRLSPLTAVIPHSKQCKLDRQRPDDPCTCGADRKHRQVRADMIDAHLCCGGTMSHSNALEIWEYWAQTEAELTTALACSEKYEARLNLAAETYDFDPEHGGRPRS